MLHVKKKCKLDIHPSQFCVKKTLTWYEERCSRSRGLVTNIFPSTGSILNTSFGGWSAPTPVMLYRIEMSWSWSERICIPTKKKECSVNPSYTLHFINPCSFFNLIDFMALFLSCIQEATLKKNIVSIGNLLLFVQYWVWGVYYSRIYDIQFFKNHLLYIIHWKHARTHNQRKKKLTPRWHFITRGDIILPHINFSCLRLGMMADLQFNLRSSHWLCNSQSRKHLSPLCYCIDTTEEAHINFNWMLAGISSYHCIKDVAKYSGLNCK